MKKTKLRIHTWPEKILRKKCQKVKKVDAEIKSIFNEMLALMRFSGGVGLAANQAGLNLSLLVIEIENQIFKLINPRIVEKKGVIKFSEGCLSFPGLELDIKRANKVKVLAQDEENNQIEIEAEGFLAVIFQHEIDHIEGIVFIDRASFWQRAKAGFKLRKIIKKTNEMSKSKDKY